MSSANFVNGLLGKLIASRKKEINTERLRRNAFELSFLVELVLAGYASDEPDTKLRANLKRLYRVVGDTVERLRGSSFEECADLCQSLFRVLKALVENESKPALVDLQFLKPLTDAILVGFYPERSQSEISQEIIQSINLYEVRQKARQD